MPHLLPCRRRNLISATENYAGRELSFAKINPWQIFHNTSFSVQRLNAIIRNQVYLKQTSLRRTLWIFRLLFYTRIDDVAHPSAAKRLSCTCLQVWVVSAGFLANLFQGSNAFYHHDNIRNRNKECFSDELRSRSLSENKHFSQIEPFRKNKRSHVVDIASIDFYK